MGGNRKDIYKERGHAWVRGGKEHRAPHTGNGYTVMCRWLTDIKHFLFLYTLYVNVQRVVEMENCTNKMYTFDNNKSVHIQTYI